MRCTAWQVAVVGAIAIWMPDVAGNGYEPLNALLNQQLAVDQTMKRSGA